METSSGQELAPGFKISELLCQDTQFSTYRALALNTNRPVIIKTAKNPEWLKEEYNLLNRIELKGTLKPLSIDLAHSPPFMVLESFNGELLRRIIDNRKPSIQTKLKVSLNLLYLLNQIHEMGCVVKNLNPSSILANLENHEVRLLQVSSFHNPEEKTSAYTSNEVKENLTCDYRSDYYSFGMILYEWLTGLNPAELKLKKRFFAPHSIEPLIPKDLSDIVMKLVSAHSNERYQTPPVLLNDLKKVMSDLEYIPIIKPEKITEIKPFDPVIPTKLYGRKKALATLQAEILSLEEGRPQILFLEGASGVGKTSMEFAIKELIQNKPILMATGKYDAFKSSVPFYGILLALKSLIRDVLVLEEGRLHVLKEQLEKNLGVNLSKLAEILPEVEQIFDKEPLPKAEDKDDLLLDSLSNFIKSFTQNKYSLIFFLDDMQWADVSSLDLIVHLFKGLKQDRIFFILSFRKQDIKAIDPPHMLKDRLQRHFIRYSEIVLTPLSFEDIVQLLEETFLASRDRILPLAEIFYSKTSGNPFFIKQLIKYLSEKKIFFYNTQNEIWDWSIDEIRKMSLSDNVIDLIAHKISNLTPNTRDLLKLAACTGHTFYADLIAKVSHKTLDQIRASLIDAVKEGFITKNGSDFTPPLDEETLKKFESLQFIHDKIQLAAYSLIAEENRKAIHLQIGQHLLQNASQEEIEKEIFEVVYQINRAKDLIKSDEEHKKAAELNLKAGKKAMRSNAYGIASDYLKTALEFLPSDKWEKEYDLTFTIHLNLVECIYLQGKFEEAIREFNLLLNQAKTLDNRLAILHLKIKLFISTANYEEALNTGRLALTLLGVRLPSKPYKIQILYQYILARLKLSLKPKGYLTNLPPMQDEHDLKVIQFLAVMFPPAYLYSKEFLSYLVLWAINKTLSKGSTPIAPMVFTCFAVISNTIKRDIKFSYKMGLDSLEMMTKFHDRQWISPLNFLFGTFLAPFQLSLRKSFDYLHRGFEIGISQGDFIYAIFSLIQMSYFEIIMGEPLKSLEAKAKYRLDIISKLKEENRSQAILGIYQMIKALRGETEHPFSLSDGTFNEKNFFSYLREKGYLTSKYIMLTFKAELYYLFDLPDMAIETIKRSEGYVYYTQEQPIQVENAFYYALSLAKSYYLKDIPTRQHYRVELKNLLKKLKRWSNECPENYEMKYHLVKAEIAWIEKDESLIQKSFDLALLSAAHQEMPQVEAIAYERYAEYFKSLGNLTLFKQFIASSHQKYYQWGAIAKVQELEKKFPWLTTQGLTDSEVDLKNNPEKLLKIIKNINSLENTYSKEGFLQSLTKLIVAELEPHRILIFSQSKNTLTLYSEWVEGEALSLRNKDETEVAFPSTLVKAQIEEMKPLVISNFIENPKLKNDPYMVKYQIDSLIILPFMVNLYKGAIYIENVKDHSKTNLEALLLMLPTISHGLYTIDETAYKNQLKTVDLNQIVLDQKNIILENLKKEIPHFILNVDTDFDPSLEKVYCNPEEVEVKVHLFLESAIRNSIKNERSKISFKTGTDQKNYKIKCLEENQSLELEAFK